NTGRGKAAIYDSTALLRLLIVFEMLQLGLSPEKSVQLIKWFSPIMIDVAGYAGLSLDNPIDPDDEKRSDDYDRLVILLDPSGLATLAHPDDEGEKASGTFSTCLLDELDSTILDHNWRMAAINTTHLIGRASIILREHEGITCQEFGSDLLKWAEQSEWSPSD